MYLRCSPDLLCRLIALPVSRTVPDYGEGVRSDSVEAEIWENRRTEVERERGEVSLLPWTVRAYVQTFYSPHGGRTSSMILGARRQ